MLQVRYPQPMAVHRTFWSGGTIICRGHSVPPGFPSVGVGAQQLHCLATCFNALPERYAHVLHFQRVCLTSLPA